MGGLVFDDAPKDRPRQRMLGSLPGSSQEGNGQRLTHAKKTNHDVSCPLQIGTCGVSIYNHSVGVVTHLGSSPKFHGHTRAQLDVNELVEREPGSHSDQIQWRLCFHQGLECRCAGGTSPM